MVPGPRSTWQLLERFKDTGQMQEAVAKIKAHLEKAKGIELCELLDQLVDAQDKLNNSAVNRFARGIGEAVEGNYRTRRRQQGRRLQAEARDSRRSGRRHGSGCGRKGRGGWYCHR